MGWSKSTDRWEPLGTQSVTGDLENGFAISAPFVPDDYEVLTFGSLAVPEELLTLENYYLSPNGDGINDFLVIEALDGTANNRVEIFDRNGLKVFQQDNYNSEFTGFSNVDGLVLNAEKGLPEGVYYFVVTLPEPALQLQGYLFLDR
jgi:gliding motility-associated-like protein